MKELQDKIKEVKQNRDKAEKPLLDAIESVARARDAHVHDIERICYAPERAKTFEQLVHRTAGHQVQDEQISKIKDSLYATATNLEREFLLVDEKRLQDRRKPLAQEYGRYYFDHNILRGIARAQILLKPEHFKLLVAEMKKIASPEVASWL